MANALIVIGLAIAGVGLAMLLGVPLGRLPGDVAIRRGHATLYVPLATSVVLSLALSVVLWLLRR